MGLIAAYAVPHPPLIVPAVGRGEEQGIANTIAAYEEVARRVQAANPETIVITSPHAPLYRDGFFVANTPWESGSLQQFGCPNERISVQVDLAFSDEVVERLQGRSITCAGAPRGANDIDHASFVPLHFLEQALDLDQVNVVRIGLSGLSSESHRVMGEAIADTANALERRYVLIASGDMSHKLKESGPYGFAPEGPEFDRAVTKIFAEGRLEELFGLDDDLCERAAECGLRSFQIMAGALEATDKPYTSELLSYEGPFGVGYAVAAFEIKDEEDAATATSQGDVDAAAATQADPLVALAREAVEHVVRTGLLLPLPSDLSPALTDQRDGAFVSLHIGDALRGCIGTISPVQPTLAEEIIANGAHAATRDPRFPAVQESELDFLSYSVDVLGKAEEVRTLSELDPKRYGVIVTSGFRRGLLLPDLDGVDTVEDQIVIAKRKAGIGLHEAVTLERFEVVRHTCGGEARSEDATRDESNKQ